MSVADEVKNLSSIWKTASDKIVKQASEAAAKAAKTIIEKQGK